MELKLKKTTIEDAQFIKSLFNNSEYESYFYENDTSIEIWKERFEYYKTKESNIIYEENKFHLGWLLYSLDNDICNIDIIVLKNELRGNKYGYFELKTLENKLASNIKYMKLDVQKRNQKALDFYLRYGFKIVGREKQDTAGGKLLYYNMSYQLKK